MTPKKSLQQYHLEKCEREGRKPATLSKTKKRKKRSKEGEPPKNWELCLKADELARAYFHSHGECLAAGYEYNGKMYQCSRRFEWCHIKSSRHRTIRHSPLNAVCMCNTHHRLFTEHPDLWTAFIEEKFPGRWDHLNAVLLEGGKPDYQYYIDFYQKELKKIA